MERKRIAALALAAAVSAVSLAQESASYKLKEHTLNAGGSPAGGVNLSSASYQLTLSALGDAVAVLDASSASYQAGSGFVAPYPPPGETLNLAFAGPATLAWTPEISVGAYNLYRGDVGNLASGYGAYHQCGLLSPGASVPGNPAPNGTFFYLVTAENRLAEEGTLGAESGGANRPNASPCP